MRTALMLTTIAALLAGCKTTTPATGSAASDTAWSASFDPPAGLDTDRVHLEPLTPEHAALDHAAFMSSREHLHSTLHWGSWPRPDTTVEDNRKDLGRHEREFDAREAYAYTVLAPDRAACVGCVYLSPVEGDPRAVELSYWVTAAGVKAGLDEHLFAAVLAWLEQSWPFDTVVINLHVDNTRGIQIAEGAGLARTDGAPEDHVAFTWRRTG